MTLFPSDPDLADRVRAFLVDMTECGDCWDNDDPALLLARWDAAVAAATAPEADDPYDTVSPEPTRIPVTLRVASVKKALPSAVAAATESKVCGTCDGDCKIPKSGFDMVCPECGGEGVVKPG